MIPLHQLVCRCVIIFFFLSLGFIKAELHRSVFAVRFLETDPRFFRTRRSPVRFGVRFDRFETDAFRVTDFLAIISVTVLPSVLNGEPVIKTLGPTLAIKGEGYSRDSNP